MYEELDIVRLGILFINVNRGGSSHFYNIFIIKKFLFLKITLSDPDPTIQFKGQRTGVRKFYKIIKVKETLTLSSHNLLYTVDLTEKGTQQEHKILS